MRSTGAPQIKRIYDEADAADGFRALVVRLWSRGISKQRAALDDWLVDLRCSTPRTIRAAITPSYCATCCAGLNAT